ncbi:MAG: ATP-binding protein [Candidatus Brocadiia bacterium]
MAASGKLSIRMLILAAMLFIALVPMTITAYQGYHCAKRAVVDGEEAHLLALLASRKAVMDKELSELRADFRFIAKSSCAMGALGNGTVPVEWCNELETFISRGAVGEAVFYLDPNFNPVMRTLPKGDDAPLDAPDAFLRSLKGVSTIQLFGPYNTAGRTRLLMGTSITSNSGTALGYIVARFVLDDVMRSISSDQKGLRHSGRVFFALADGMIVPLGAAPGRFEQLPLLRENLVTEYTTSSGIDMLATVISMQPLDMRAVLVVEASEAFLWLAILRENALITAFLTLTAAILFSLLVSIYLSRPWERFAAVSRRIASGMHSERVGEMAIVEAEEMRTTFNTMLDELAISERKLVQSASLAAVGELSSSVVHEIRNPLSTIKMNLQALKRKVGEEEPWKELSAIAFLQVVRIETMLIELLSFGKPLILQPEAIDLRATMDEVQSSLTSEIKRNSAVIRLTDELKGARVLVDPEQFKRVLSNLLANAIQAGGTPPVVEVIVRVWDENPAQARIRICDNGKGIKPEAMNSIFQPFFTTKPDGTGLGLAIVKKIVESSGGTVAAENSPAGGAVFTVNLPLRN